jgi:hypothetical protein
MLIIGRENAPTNVDHPSFCVQRCRSKSICRGDFCSHGDGFIVALTLLRVASAHAPKQAREEYCRVASVPLCVTALAVRVHLPSSYREAFAWLEQCFRFLPGFLPVNSGVFLEAVRRCRDMRRPPPRLSGFTTLPSPQCQPVGVPVGGARGRTPTARAARWRSPRSRTAERAWSRSATPGQLDDRSWFRPCTPLGL